MTYCLRVLARFESLYTVAHVLAEVSNLTDLPGNERKSARDVLKATISTLKEVEMPSARAEKTDFTNVLGLSMGQLRRLRALTTVQC